ncbi:hypothetical protein [Natronomonas sp.]|uniref:hypothetical protein n=1 Tax=Natronomonas sp. TaxID=2184060 RepID=UPI00262C1A38|nr:hypothetical protein [Natronomonas sp.]
MSDSFLIYDGRNRLFRAVARRVERFSGTVRLVPWRAAPARRFFEAQFGDHVFAFALIDPDADAVHVGTRTVRRLLRDRGVPEVVVAGAERAYAAAGDRFGRLVHGRAPADIDGTFPIADAARPHLGSLRRECSAAACTPSGSETGR